jgi:hypothetical protein
VHIVSEFGADQMLRRLSDPFWFQAFGCVLGFDWHSSGVTTTVTGALKEGIRGLEGDLGFYAGGGKGAASRQTPAEIARACERLSIDPRPLVYASRMSAKVDSAAVQDGYQLYHHAFFFTPSGGWCVVQQGMNGDNGMARRYHRLSTAVRSYVNEPHAAICAEVEAPTLNLVASESEAVRIASAELSRQQPSVVLSAITKIPALTMPRRHEVLVADVHGDDPIAVLVVPAGARRPGRKAAALDRGDRPRGWMDCVPAEVPPGASRLRMTLTEVKWRPHRKWGVSPFSGAGFWTGPSCRRGRAADLPNAIALGR